MLFNSLDFLIFFAFVYAVYLVLPHRGQNILLLVASYYFYGSWDYRFLSLIALSTTVDHLVATRIYQTDDQRKRRQLLAVSMVVNLGVLGFFKYFNFFIGSMESLISGFGYNTANLHLNIVLPVGISFYTFQSMSYTIDVYRRELVPAKKITDYALFVSLFTQLVAGPIERATQLLPQVLNKRVVTWPNIQIGAWLFLWGLFKKLVIGDNVAGIADDVFAGNVEWTTGTVLLGVYAFAIQIYCDFSAYSDMARGLGFFLGFDIMINFRNPYFALNPSDFWRRWHISLSTWLRDYLYIPLGGNRKGVRRTYINLFLTMLLGGLWHGAAWTFVAWGAFHGGLLAVHRWVRGDARGESIIAWPGRLWRMFVMFHAVCFGWLLFRATSMAEVGGMLSALVTRPEWSVICSAWTFQIAVLSAPLLLIQIMQERTGNQLAPLNLSLVPRTILYATIMVMLVTLANTGSRAFIYFQF
jgi:alginate O-acetyltransferase complex protein AlgI